MKFVVQRSVLAVAAATILAASAVTYAVAQDTKDKDSKALPPAAENTWKPSPADRAAFAAARVAALHAGLALTPDQEKLWPPVESVLKELAQKHEAHLEALRQERRAAREKGERPDPMSRLRQTADRLSEAGADLKRLADTAQPLYEKLDDQQKQRLREMVRHGMRERIHHRMMHRFSAWRDRMQNWRGDDHQQGMMRGDHDRMRNEGRDNSNDDYGTDSEERL
jgi:hypothetical protein